MVTGLFVLAASAVPENGIQVPKAASNMTAVTSIVKIFFITVSFALGLVTNLIEGSQLQVANTTAHFNNQSTFYKQSICFKFLA
jgi:preprotein translocase subunit SecG